MYIFGIDIPLLELVLALGFISIVILVELIAILVMISFHMKHSKKLEEEIGKLSYILLNLQKEEYNELDRLGDLTEKEQGIIENLYEKGMSESMSRDKLRKLKDLAQKEGEIVNKLSKLKEKRGSQEKNSQK